MKPYTKTYMDFFGHQVAEDVECEICGNPAVDINHIDARGMGGNPLKDKDKIENLMAMCRLHHLECGDVPTVKPMLRLIHVKFMKYRGRKDKVSHLNPPIDEMIRILGADIRDTAIAVRELKESNYKKQA